MNIQKGRIDTIPDELLSESRQDLVIKSTKRWREAKPDLHLTWAKEVSGDAFIKKVLTYATFEPNKNILEIGPGYGRLLKAILNENLSFNSFYGIDISSANVDYLKSTFTAPNIYFINANAEDFKLYTTFDIVISSLTFKHIYPSFEKALSNIHRHMKNNAIVSFDLIEGNMAFFEKTPDTYIRYYSKQQVKELIQHVDLELIEFDKVSHAPGYSRLLVIARKPSR